MRPCTAAVSRVSGHGFLPLLNPSVENMARTIGTDTDGKESWDLAHKSFSTLGRCVIITRHILYVTNILHTDVFQCKTELVESTKYSIRKRKINQLWKSVQVIVDKVILCLEATEYSYHLNFELTCVADSWKFWHDRCRFQRLWGNEINFSFFVVPIWTLIDLVHVYTIRQNSRLLLFYHSWLA